jgi:hypothetical protein
MKDKVVIETMYTYMLDVIWRAYTCALQPKKLE